MTKIISVLKHLVPRPLRPAVRKCALVVFPSLKYAARMRNELNTFTGIENVHDLPTIAHYWSEKYLIPIFEPFGFRNSVEFFRNYIGQVCSQKAGSTIRILSVGAGNAATEINIGEWLRENGIENYTFECVDINAEVLKVNLGIIDIVKEPVYSSKLTGKRIFIAPAIYCSFIEWLE